MAGNDVGEPAAGRHSMAGGVAVLTHDTNRR